ncbi:hypothetical protein BDQ17DRAFT_1327405 [Cyathus striatus]|nr:hypothetical protein BDQ17DRAFT_1327405 [Cyathus striatus]
MSRCNDANARQKFDRSPITCGALYIERVKKTDQRMEVVLNDSNTDSSTHALTHEEEDHSNPACHEVGSLRREERSTNARNVVDMNFIAIDSRRRHRRSKAAEIRAQALAASKSLGHHLIDRLHAATRDRRDLSSAAHINEDVCYSRQPYRARACSAIECSRTQMSDYPRKSTNIRSGLGSFQGSPVCPKYKREGPKNV